MPDNMHCKIHTDAAARKRKKPERFFAYTPFMVYRFYFIRGTDYGGQQIYESKV